MTGRELVELLGGHRALLVAILLLPCVAAPLMGLLHGRGGGTKAPWRHAYAVITYLACVPGMLAAVLTGYVVLFSRENLLDLDLLVFVAPLVTMSAALLLIRRNVSFNDVPGFDRLAGLMVMLAGAFIVTLVLARLRVLLVFGGTIASFLLLAGLVFAFMKWGAHLLMRRTDEPRQGPPVIPGL